LLNIKENKINVCLIMIFIFKHRNTASQEYQAEKTPLGGSCDEDERVPKRGNIEKRRPVGRPR
jgi:hypothetical protein